MIPISPRRTSNHSNPSNKTSKMSNVTATFSERNFSDDLQGLSIAEMFQSQQQLQGSTKLVDPKNLTLRSFLYVVPSEKPVDSFLWSVNMNPNGFTRIASCFDAAGVVPNQSHTQKHFQDIFDGYHSFSQNSFNSVLEPLLIRVVTRLENVMAVYCGPPSLSCLNSNDGMGIQQHIFQSANYLLQEANKKQFSVLLTWYRIDCGASEVIHDVLKAASTSHMITNDQFVLREIGRGLSPVVPGLLEIELHNALDINAVLEHVNSKTSISNHSQGSNHMVIQLSFVSKTADHQYENEKFKLGGKISFVFLGDLSPSTPKNKIYPIQMYPWISHMETVISWIEKKQISPPFHKSRILLIMRELICGRQAGSIILSLQPSPVNIPICNYWLQLISKIDRDAQLLGSVQWNSAMAESFPVAMQCKGYNNENNSRNSSADVNESHTLSSLASLGMMRNATSKTIAQSAAGNLNNLIVEPKKAIASQNNANHFQDAKDKNNTDPYNSYSQREEEAKLRLELDVARHEVEKMKQQVIIEQTKTQQCMDLYDSLIEQLKQEGSMLSKNDQQRYRSTLQELKETRNYQQVMEDKVLSLETQLQTLSEENNRLQVENQKTKRVAEKNKSSTDKYHYELSTTRKELILTRADLNKMTSKYENLQQHYRKLQADIRMELSETKQEIGRQSELLLLTREELVLSRSRIEELEYENAQLKAIPYESRSSQEEETDFQESRENNQSANPPSKYRPRLVRSRQ